MSRNKRRPRVTLVHRDTVLVTLRAANGGPQLGLGLVLPADLPELMRFVTRRGDFRTLAALPYAGDCAAPGELVYAARRYWTGSTNIPGATSARRPRQWWFTEVQYQMLSPQPPQDVIRDYDAWSRWCSTSGNC